MANNIEEINYIQEHSNIVDIISSYITLNRSGKDYVGICPFHDDHSPSMHVSPQRNMFKCFVCNTAGNVFSFVKKYENVSFPEAVKIVAEKSGLDFSYSKANYKENKFKKEYEIMDLSLMFYQNNLASKNGIKAKEYLNNRGITEDIIKKCKFGLSLEGNELTKFLTNKKVDLNLACDLGLLNKSGVDYYDMFTERIMIPIMDMTGHLVGYTARSYLKDDKNKYINSKETILYKKSNIIFNYYLAKDKAREEKEIIIVEGNMDAISLSSSGINNVVALMGVVISDYQIEALKRLNSKVILMLDNDNAGLLATKKVGDALYEAGLDTHVVRLSGAKDPDEYIRKYGKEKLQDAIKHSTKYIDFKIESLKDNTDLNTIEGLTGYIKTVIASLNNANEIDREVTISKICKDYNIDPEIIKKELKPVESKPKTTTTIVKPKARKSRYILAVYELLYAMLLNKDYFRIYLNELGYLLNKEERELASMIGGYIKKYNTINEADFISYVESNEKLSEILSDIIATNQKENVTEKEFYDILNTVSICINEEEIKRLKEEIKKESDINRQVELMDKLAKLKKGCGNNERNKDI